MDDDFGLLRAIAKFFAFIIVEVIYQIGFILIAVWFGRVTVMILTIGKYPTNEQAQDHEVLLGIIGLIVIFSIATIAYEYS